MDITEIAEQTYRDCTRFIPPSISDCLFFIFEEVSETARALMSHGVIGSASYLRDRKGVSMWQQVRKEYGQLVFMVGALGFLLDFNAEEAAQEAANGFRERDKRTD